MYLFTQNLTLLKDRERKLVPKYIGPYKVIKAHNEASMITLCHYLLILADGHLTSPLYLLSPHLHVSLAGYFSIHINSLM